MGPDEFITREEANLLFRLLFAKIQQHAEFVAELGAILQTNGSINPPEYQDLMERLDRSEHTKKARKARAELGEFLTIHKTVREYLGPLEE